MIERLIQNQILKRLDDPKAIIILGPRQVGKSTLLRMIQERFRQPVSVWNGDDSDIRTMLSAPTSHLLGTIVGRASTLVIDEAQRIENIGLVIKIITDQIPGVKVIATGSSSLDLANKINEPLTGRKWEFRLFPFSFEEMADASGFLEERRLLEHRLIFGYYPEVVNNPGDERERLAELSQSYLYRDILQWESVLKPEKLEKLLQALALQLGSEVSYSELGRLTGLDNATVERYIQILEQSFVIFRLPGFNRNLRNELKKSRKVYFYDNGIRNAIINNYNLVPLRTDIGALWENFLISERQKSNAYHRRGARPYFWRTHAQQEIDYLEEDEGRISAFEFKWNSTRAVRFPKNFVETYEPEETKVITPENFHEFVISK